MASNESAKKKVKKSSGKTSEKTSRGRSSRTTKDAKVAVVAGATGLVGRYLLRDLLNSSQYSKVIALVRRPLRLKNEKLIEQLVQFGRLTSSPSPESLDGADLFCTLGTTIKKAGSQEAFHSVDHDAVVEFALWGKNQGAERFFVVTAMGANANSPIFYNRVKGETEYDLQSVGFREVHAVRPSLLLGPREESRIGEKIAARVSGPLGFLFLGPLAKYRPIQAADVAKAMIRIAETTASGSGFEIHESDELQALAR